MEILFRRIDKILETLVSEGRYETHPYDLGAISNAILANSFIDEMRYERWPDVDDGPIAGTFTLMQEQTSVYGEVKTIARIFVNPSLDFKWRRFVACKEMCHALWQDLPHFRTTSHEDLIRIAEHVSMSSPAKIVTPQVLDEDTAIAIAVELLAPFEFREILRPMVRNGEITIAQISDRFGIPEVIAEFSFSDSYMKLSEDSARKRFVDALTHWVPPR